MTFSNGHFNPNPLANPFNTRLGPANYSLNPSNMQPQRMSINTKSSALPDPIPFNGIDSSKLQVPNQDIPLGDQLKGNGFVNGSDSIFTLQDGTVLDFKARKVLFDPNKKNSQYWGDPNRTLEFNNPFGDHPQNDFNSLIDNAFNGNQNGNQNGNAAQLDDQLDPASISYWMQAEKEAQELKDKMSDDQKKMIQDFEDHFPMSRLIEESMKRRK